MGSNSSVKTDVIKSLSCFSLLIQNIWTWTINWLKTSVIMSLSNTSRVGKRLTIDINMFDAYALQMIDQQSFFVIRMPWITNKWSISLITIGSSILWTMDAMSLLGTTEVMVELKELLLHQTFDLMEWLFTDMFEKNCKFEERLVSMVDLLEESSLLILQTTLKTLIF